jgi:taurine dioxygenase
MTTLVPSVQLDITPLTGLTGAEIRGVDLRRTLAESTVADILAALVEYKVIFFPGQHLCSCKGLRAVDPPLNGGSEVA